MLCVSFDVKKATRAPWTALRFLSNCLYLSLHQQFNQRLRNWVQLLLQLKERSFVETLFVACRPSIEKSIDFIKKNRIRWSLHSLTFHKHDFFHLNFYVATALNECIQNFLPILVAYFFDFYWKSNAFVLFSKSCFCDSAYFKILSLF